MRKAIAGLLVVLTLAISAPLVGADQSGATLLGQLVDAGGRGAVGRSVELIRDGSVVTTTTTSVNGEFVFAGVAPGSYVVRTTVNSQAAGTKVAVNAGENVPVTVVLPSLATASPVAAAVISGLMSGILSGTSVLTTQLWAVAQQTEDFQYLTGVNFVGSLQFLGNIFQGLEPDFVARAIKIGPYATS